MHHTHEEIIAMEKRETERRQEEANAKKHAEALAALTAMDEANDLIPLSVLNAVLNREIPGLKGWK